MNPKLKITIVVFLIFSVIFNIISLIDYQFIDDFIKKY